MARLTTLTLTHTLTALRTVGDLTRGLTDKGETQAVAAKAWLDTHELRAVICSEALRATATMAIMTGGRFPKDGPGSLTLHTLHPSRFGTPEGEKMFDKLGCTYASRTLDLPCPSAHWLVPRWSPCLDRWHVAYVL